MFSSRKKFYLGAATLNLTLLGSLIVVGMYSTTMGLAADTSGARRINQALHEVRESQNVLRRERAAISQDLAQASSERDAAQIRRELDDRDRQIKSLMNEERLIKRFLAEKKTDMAFFKRRSGEIERQLREIETDLSLVKKHHADQFIPSVHQPELQATHGRIEERKSRLLDEKRVLEKITTARFRHKLAEDRVPAQTTSLAPAVNDRLF